MGYLRRLATNSRILYSEAGVKGLINKVPEHSNYIFKRVVHPELYYKNWLRKYEADLFDNYLNEVEITNKPKISIITPLYNVPHKYLKDAVESVEAQTYENWELCIHNDASTENLENLDYVQNLSQVDKRIKYSSSDINENISVAMNHALDLATGEYFIILDNDDMLHPRALEMLVRTLNSNPDLRYIYSDEDKMEPNGKRTEPVIKPGWSPHLTLAQMYTTHISMFETELVKEIGGLRVGYEAAQDYDLVMRYTELIDFDQVARVPLFLYHWRKIPGSTAVSYESKSTSKAAGRKALEDTVKRRGFDTEVDQGLTVPSFRIRYKIKGDPKVSIIIPTHNLKEVLKTCVDSILEKTDYDNYEIIVINNNSDEKDALEYLSSINKEDGIQVFDYNEEFNFSAINNFGVEKSSGDFVLLLNNDVEVLNRGWLIALLELAQLPEVGAVGAMLIDPDGKYQHVGVATGIRDIAGHVFRGLPSSNPGYLGYAHLIRNVSAVTAATLLVEKEKYQEVGGLNEQLRVAFNDIDFCLELDKAGYLNLYTPFSKLTHYESLSRGSDQDPARIEEFKKEIKFMKDKWGDRIPNDPFYNPNLSEKYEDFTLRVK